MELKIPKGGTPLSMLRNTPPIPSTVYRASDPFSSLLSAKATVIGSHNCVEEILAYFSAKEFEKCVGEREEVPERPGLGNWVRGARGDGKKEGEHHK